MTGNMRQAPRSISAPNRPRALQQHDAQQTAEDPQARKPELLRRVFANWRKLVCGRVLALALSIAALLLARRALPDTALAEFFWFMSLHALLALAALAGLGTALVPALARCPEAERMCVVHDATARARKRGLILALLFGASALLLASRAPWMPLVALSIAAQVLHLGASPSLAHGATRALVLVEVLGRSLSLGCFGLLAGLGQEGAGLWLLAWTLPPLVATLGYARSMPASLRPVLGPRALLGWATRRMQRPGRIELAELDSKHWIDRSSLGDLTRALYLYGAPLALGILAGDRFAEFGFAHRLFLIVTLLPAALATSLAGPLAQGARLSSLRNLRSQLPTLAMLAVPAMILAFGAGLLVFVAKDSIANSGLPYFAVLLAGLPALFVSAGCLPWLLAHRYEDRVLTISLAGLVTTAATLALLWPLAGLMGGAVSIVLGEAMVALLASATILGAHRAAQQVKLAAEHETQPELQA